MWYELLMSAALQGCAMNGVGAVDAKPPWLEDNYGATPVLPALQEGALARLPPGVALQIDAHTAQELSGDAKADRHKFHYLARAGQPGPGPYYPQGVRIGAAVDSSHTGFVYYFALGEYAGSIPFAVILSGDVEVTAVVAVCDTAR